MASLNVATGPYHGDADLELRESEYSASLRYVQSKITASTSDRRHATQPSVVPFEKTGGGMCLPSDGFMLCCRRAALVML